MSRARMIQLKEALERTGWKISGESETEGIFYVSDEEIVWRLSNLWTGKKTQLTFYLFDYLGRRTEKLGDISYVVEKEKGLELYFSKIKTEKWKSDLKMFVRSLYPPMP